MIDVSKLSRRFAARALGDPDIDEILGLCAENTQFYRYSEAEPTRAQVERDMRLTPPGVGLSDKYFVGFYREGELIAVMDIVDGYPAPDIAYIGFFMMRLGHQGRGTGSAVVGEALDALKAAGKRAARLAIDKHNPQSNHFWRRNGFHVIREVDRNGWPVLEAERVL